VIDGGPAQVAAAARALGELGIDDVAACGLAKRLEEVWLPGDDSPVILPRTSEVLYLLQRVRDEAHRFAITYHRAKRSKALAVSELDSVPGLGPARRATLLRHFGSVRRLASASEAEIAGFLASARGSRARCSPRCGRGHPRSRPQRKRGMGTARRMALTAGSRTAMTMARGMARSMTRAQRGGAMRRAVNPAGDAGDRAGRR